MPGAPLRVHAWTAALVPACVALVFATALLGPGNPVLSHLSTDTARQFLSWRAFGFGELAQGRLPLWNPYLYSGTPYLGGFQAALFYPLNWVHLVFTTPTAINLEILLNLTLLGLATYGWLLRSGHSPAACLSGSVCVTLGGTVAPHVYAGHLTNLAALAWTPLVLLSLDGAWDTLSPSCRHWRQAGRWVALGAGAVALQILAGHPQYVYYTAVAAGLYLGARALTLTGPPEQRARACLRGAGILLAVYLGGAALGAVQLLPGLQAAAESLRGAKLSVSSAALFSFPPENLLTFFVPYALGDLTTLPYWGRWYLWEVCVFLGSAAVPLAVWTVTARRRRPVSGLADALTAVALLVLAAGAYTAVYGPLYHYLPGFGSFRCSAKFIFPAGLFVVRLAASGLDRLSTDPVLPVPFLRVLAALAATGAALTLALFLAAVSPSSAAARAWSGLMRAVLSTGQCSLPAAVASEAPWLTAAAFCAASSCLRSTSFLAGITLCACLRRRLPSLALALPALVLLEMTAFAANLQVTFAPDALGTAALRDLAKTLQPGQRILYLPSPNLPMLLGLPDVWGNDPSLLRRYAEFIAFTQGYKPQQVRQDISVAYPHPLLQLAACRYLVHCAPRYDSSIESLPTPLPRLRLVNSWTVHPRRGDLLGRLLAADFAPEREVVLEEDPGLHQDPSAPPGTVTLLGEDSDHLDLRIDTPGAAVLVVSQAYSRFWTARALQPAAGQPYRLVPAYYAFQGVPLPAGRHELRLEYRLPSLRWGAALSGISLAALCAGLVLVTRGQAKAEDGSETGVKTTARWH